MKTKHSENAKYETVTQVNAPVHGRRFISKHSVMKPVTDWIFNKAGRKFSINSGKAVFHWTEQFFESVCFTGQVLTLSPNLKY